MILRQSRTKALLKNSEFEKLFIEELGWDNPRYYQPSTLDFQKLRFELVPIAEKEGVKIFRCDRIPKHHIRLQIEKEITKVAFEHLIIYVDEDSKEQVWQWVSREKGRPNKIREYKWDHRQSTELLIQKLEHIRFNLKDESKLTLTGIVMRLTSAFDRLSITRQFFKSFSEHQKIFLKQITGLKKNSDKSWYASLILNRLMFIYFIQKKGLLDTNVNYLREKLAFVKKDIGNNNFFNFYKSFLLHLFHDGLAKPKEFREKKFVKIIGNVPYLNGGLFEKHILEKDNDININDTAFKRIFDFFDKYEWTLDTRKTQSNKGNEINPDVLGYIFEKYINQKEMGAYYTQEDVTDYISKNTIIPWIFNNICDDATEKRKLALEIENFLSEDYNDYFYDEAKFGSNHPIPDIISKGREKLRFRRYWNNQADEAYGLPTESWREVVHRRVRYEGVVSKLSKGQISLEDFVTYNLDIRKFTEGFIYSCKDIEIVRQLYNRLRAIKILDPACGSGAFLFAALGVLYDLYNACIERIDELDLEIKHTDGYRKDKDNSGNRAYFIYKTIIVNNLYGVDIMEEAIEICKLRLFLKLAAYIDNEQEIEPLPDIDFNIRAGNTLVGYTSIEQFIRINASDGFDFENRLDTVKREFATLDREIATYREGQVQPIDNIVADNGKQSISNRLQSINRTLNKYLGNDYGMNIDESVTDSAKFEQWVEKHKPFNWITEFHDIVANGGFDIILGNPPYLEQKDIGYVPEKLKTYKTKAVHAYFVERADELLTREGGMSMILPMSLVCTNRMKDVQNIIENNRKTWYSNFSWRPGKLFEEVNRSLTIFIASSSKRQKLYTTGYIRWASEARDVLFRNLNYTEVLFRTTDMNVPKFQHTIEASIVEKLFKSTMPMENIFGGGGEAKHTVFQKTRRLVLEGFYKF